MHRTLAIASACALAVLVLLSGPARAAADALDDCTELMSLPVLTCDGSEEHDELCDTAALMSLEPHWSELVSLRNVANPVHAGWSRADIGNAPLCPPGSAPVDDSCRVLPRNEGSPAPGGSAPMPDRDPLLFSVTDEAAIDSGRSVVLPASTGGLAPGFERGVERPPRARVSG